MPEAYFVSDLSQRLFNLTRAHLGSRSDTRPVGDNPYAKSSGRHSNTSSSYDEASSHDDGTSDASHESAADPNVDDELAGYYANLEIPYGSDLATVRTAWKRMMKTYHPDLHGDDPQKRQVAGELTAELTRAYQALSASLGGDK